MSYQWLKNDWLDGINPLKLVPPLFKDTAPVSKNTDVAQADVPINGKPSAPVIDRFACGDTALGIQEELALRGVKWLDKSFALAGSALQGIGDPKKNAAKIVDLVKEIRNTGRLYQIRLVNDHQSGNSQKGELIYLLMWAIDKGDPETVAKAFNELAEVLSVFDQDHRVHAQLANFMKQVFFKANMNNAEIGARLDSLRNGAPFALLEPELLKKIAVYLDAYMNKSNNLDACLNLAGVARKDIFNDAVEVVGRNWDTNSESGKWLHEVLSDFAKTMQKDENKKLTQNEKLAVLKKQFAEYWKFNVFSKNDYPFVKGGKYEDQYLKYMQMLNEKLSTGSKNISAHLVPQLNEKFNRVFFNAENQSTVRAGHLLKLDEEIIRIPMDNGEIPSHVRKELYELRLIQIESWNRSKQARSSALNKINQFIANHKSSSPYVLGQAYSIQAQVNVWVASDWDQIPHPDEESLYLRNAQAAANNANTQLAKIYGKDSETRSNLKAWANAVPFHSGMMELYVQNYLLMFDAEKMLGMRERFKEKVDGHGKGYNLDGSGLIQPITAALREMGDKRSKINDRFIFNLFESGTFGTAIKGVNELEVSMNKHDFAKVDENRQRISKLYGLMENDSLRLGMQYARNYKGQANYVEDFFKPSELSLYARVLADEAWNEAEAKNYSNVIEVMQASRTGARVEDLKVQKYTTKAELLKSVNALQPAITEITNPRLKYFFGAGVSSNKNLSDSLQYTMNTKRPWAPEIGLAQAYFWNRDFSKATALLEGVWLVLESDKAKQSIHPRDFTHLLTYLILAYQNQGKFGYTKAHKILKAILEGKAEEKFSQHFNLSGVSDFGWSIGQVREALGPLHLEDLRTLHIKNQIMGDPRYLYIDEEGKMDAELASRSKKNSSSINRHDLNAIWKQNLVLAEKDLQQVRIRKANPIITEDKELDMILSMQLESLPGLLKLQHSRISEKQPEKSKYAKDANKQFKAILDHENYFDESKDHYLYASELAGAMSDVKETSVVQHEPEVLKAYLAGQGEFESKKTARIEHDLKILAPRFEDEYSLGRLEGIFSKFGARDGQVKQAIESAQDIFNTSKHNDIRVRAVLVMVEAELYRNQPEAATKHFIKVLENPELKQEMQQKYPLYFEARTKIRILKARLSDTANVSQIQNYQQQTEQQYKVLLDAPNLLPFEKDQVRLDYANYLSLIAIKLPALLKNDPIAKALDLVKTLRGNPHLDAKTKLQLQLTLQNLYIANLQGRKPASLGHQAVDALKENVVFIAEKERNQKDLQPYSLVVDEIFNGFLKAQAHQTFKALPEKFKSKPERLKAEAAQYAEAEKAYEQVILNFEKLFKNHTENLTLDEIEALQLQMAEIQMSRMELAVKRAENLTSTLSYLDIKELDQSPDLKKQRQALLDSVLKQSEQIINAPDTRLSAMLKARARLLQFQVPQALNEYETANKALQVLNKGEMPAVENQLLSDLFPVVNRLYVIADNMYRMSKTPAKEVDSKNSRAYELQMRAEAEVYFDKVLKEVAAIRKASLGTDEQGNSKLKDNGKTQLLAKAMMVEMYVHNHLMHKDYDKAVAVFAELDEPAMKPVVAAMMQDQESHELQLMRANTFKWSHDPVLGEAADKIYNDILKMADHKKPYAENVKAGYGDFYVARYEVMLEQADLYLQRAYQLQSRFSKKNQTEKAAQLLLHILKVPMSDERKWVEINKKAMLMLIRCYNANLLDGPLAEQLAKYVDKQHKILAPGTGAQQSFYYTVTDQIEFQFEVAEAYKNTVMLDPVEQNRRLQQAIHQFGTVLPQKITQVLSQTNDYRQKAQLDVLLEQCQISLAESLLATNNDKHALTALDEVKRILDNPDLYEPSSIARARLAEINALRQLYRFDEAAAKLKDILQVISGTTLRPLREKKALLEILSPAGWNQLGFQINFQKYEDACMQAKFELGAAENLTPLYKYLLTEYGKAKAQLEQDLESKGLPEYTRNELLELESQLSQMMLKAHVYQAGLTNPFQKKLDNANPYYQEAIQVVNEQLNKAKKYPLFKKDYHYAITALLEALNFSLSHENVLDWERGLKKLEDEGDVGAIMLEARTNLKTVFPALQPREKMLMTMQFAEAKKRIAYMKMDERLKNNTVTDTQLQGLEQKYQAAHTEEVQYLRQFTEIQDKEPSAEKVEHLFNLVNPASSNERERDVAMTRRLQGGWRAAQFARIELLIKQANDEGKPGTRSRGLAQKALNLLDEMESNSTDSDSKISTLSTAEEARILVNRIFANSRLDSLPFNPQGKALQLMGEMMKRMESPRFAFEIQKFMRKENQKLFEGLNKALNFELVKGVRILQEELQSIEAKRNAGKLVANDPIILQAKMNLISAYIVARDFEAARALIAEVKAEWEKIQNSGDEKIINANAALAPIMRDVIVLDDRYGDGTWASRVNGTISAGQLTQTNVNSTPYGYTANGTENQGVSIQNIKQVIDYKTFAAKVLLEDNFKTTVFGSFTNKQLSSDSRTSQNINPSAIEVGKDSANDPLQLSMKSDTGLKLGVNDTAGQKTDLNAYEVGAQIGKAFWRDGSIVKRTTASVSYIHDNRLNYARTDDQRVNGFSTVSQPKVLSQNQIRLNAFAQVALWDQLFDVQGDIRNVRRELFTLQNMDVPAQGGGTKPFSMSSVDELNYYQGSVQLGYRFQGYLRNFRVYAEAQFSEIQKTKQFVGLEFNRFGVPWDIPFLNDDFRRIFYGSAGVKVQTNLTSDTMPLGEKHNFSDNFAQFYVEGGTRVYNWKAFIRFSKDQSFNKSNTSPTILNPRGSETRSHQEETRIEFGAGTTTDIFNP